MSKPLMGIFVLGKEWEVHRDDQDQLFWQKEGQMIGLVTPMELALLKHMNTANTALAGIHNLVPGGRIQGGGWGTLESIHAATSTYWGAALNVDPQTVYHKSIEVAEVEL